MKKRFQAILNLEGINAAQIATILGVQRSTISNIISGRNNPSFELLNSILTKFPNLNPEWLINGNGNPYKDYNKNLKGENKNDLLVANRTNSKDINFPPALDIDSTNTGTGTVTGTNTNPTSTASTNASTFNNNSVEQNRPPISTDIDSDNEFIGGLFDDIENDFDPTIEEFHPFPALEEGELDKRVKSLQESINEKNNSDNISAKPSENSLKEIPNEITEENEKENKQIKKELVKVLLLYSDGSFETFDK